MKDLFEVQIDLGWKRPFSRNICAVHCLVCSYFKIRLKLDRPFRVTFRVYICICAAGDQAFENRSAVWQTVLRIFRSRQPEMRCAFNCEGGWFVVC